MPTRLIHFSMLPTTPQFISWVRLHKGEDPAKLALAAREADFDIRQAIVQVQAHRKFAKKLPDTLAKFPDFYFPSLINGEQSTSDLLADFHASLVPPGSTVVDLTAGLGIDATHFALRAKEVTAVEQSAPVAEALGYNARGLGVDNLRVVNTPCEDFIEACIADGTRFDVAFIDPARRADDGSRLFALQDCSPDVVALLPRISRIASTLIIKASPMLDITGIVTALPVQPAQVIALGTPTECKELIAVVHFGATPGTVTIKGITLPSGPDFQFQPESERQAPQPPVCTAPREGAYICEPFPAVMKTGAFRLLSQAFCLKMFQPNTRVLYADTQPEAFPGSAYRIVKVLPYASRIIKRFAREYPRIDVAARNFGMSADALRAKLAVRDGGDLRLYAITDHRNERILIITEK